MTTVAERVDEPVSQAAAARASATPRLAFKNTAKAIEFYKQALGAKETMRFEAGGSIPHAEIVIGDSAIMLSDEWPDGGRLSAETLGYSPVQMSLDVDDVDSFAARAMELPIILANATMPKPPATRESASRRLKQEVF